MAQMKGWGDLRLQRVQEPAQREQIEAGDLKGDETLDAQATVTVRELSRDVVVTGAITLS